MLTRLNGAQDPPQPTDFYTEHRPPPSAGTPTPTAKMLRTSSRCFSNPSIISALQSPGRGAPPQLQDVKKAFEMDHKLMMTRLDRVINSDPFEVSLLKPDTPRRFLLLEY